MAEVENNVAQTQDVVLTRVPVADTKAKKKTTGSKWLKGIGCGILVIAGAISIGYVIKAQTFTKKFFPNTYINGINVSYMTPEQVQDIIKGQIANYQIVIKSRGNGEEIFKGSSVGLHYVPDETLKKMVDDQKILQWLPHMKKKDDLTVETNVELDEGLFDGSVVKLKALDEATFVAPEDAKVSSYVSGKGFSIVPEVDGNQLDVAKAKEVIKQSMLTMQPEIDLDANGNSLYANPKVRANDTQLIEAKDEMNKYASAKITYSVGETLSGETISKWLSVGEDGKAVISDSKIADYVKSMAKKYDTYNKAKTLQMTGGGTVTISGGSYGWKINQSAEAAQIKKIITEGKQVSRDFVYSRKAASHGSNDYGNSYVEVNLSAQKVYFYKNGGLVISSDFVSGNLSKGMATPGGAYSVAYKQKDAILKGQGYASPVSFWMPFNNGIGFHDAPWRSSFGGSIYKTSGSHGCINLPPSVAKVFYENISEGYPVLCFYTNSATTAPAAAPVAQPSQAPEETKAPTSETVANSAPTKSSEAAAVEAPKAN